MNTAPARYCLTPLGQRIAAENFPLVLWLHRRYPPTRPIPGDERISAGMAALVNAVALYDDRAGAKLSTYLTRSILNEWRRDEQEDALIRVPNYLRDRKERERVARTDPGRLVDADRASRAGMMSLDRHTDRSGHPLGRNLPDRSEPEAEAAEDAEQRERDRDRLRVAMDRLPEVWRRVLEMRASGYTLRQAGHMVSVTRERVRQIETQAIAALRAELGRPSPPPAKSWSGALLEAPCRSAR